MKLISAIAAMTIGLCLTNSVRGDLVISAANVATVIDFESMLAGSNIGKFAGAGFDNSPSAGQLDAGAWSVTGLSHPSDKSRGTSSGGVGTGGIYAFDTGGDNVVLGIQPDGSDFTPGEISLIIKNGTGATVDSWTIGYDVFTFNDQALANTLKFSFSADGSNYTDIGSLDFATPEVADGSPAWVSESKSTTLNASIAAESRLFLRWFSDDTRDIGTWDEYGIDNISITAVPEPSAFLFGGLVCGVLGVNHLRRRWLAV